MKTASLNFSSLKRSQAWKKRHTESYQCGTGSDGSVLWFTKDSNEQIVNRGRKSFVWQIPLIKACFPDLGQPTIRIFDEVDMVIEN